MPKDFTFYTDNVSWGIETKSSGEKIPYVQGYISTPDLDVYNDKVTSECLDDMLLQVKSGNIKLDVEHEVWRKSSRTIPVGKIIEAKRDTKGLWIKAILNKYSPQFKAIWNSVKNGFLDAFSIAFKAINSEKQIVNGIPARILKKINLLNVALTGNPVNPECTMQHVFMKSIAAIDTEKEVETMTDEKIDSLKPDEKTDLKAEEEKKKEEPKEDDEKKEKLKEDEKKKTPKEDEEKEEGVEKKSFDALATRVDALEKENTELKAQLDKPILKAQIDEKKVEETPEVKASGRTPLQTIR